MPPPRENETCQVCFFITRTSYTSSLFLENECHQTLRDAIVKLCLEMRPMDGPIAVFRTDPAPGYKALVNDPLLERFSIECRKTKTRVITLANHKGHR